jgi:hypothetical protein
MMGGIRGRKRKAMTTQATSKKTQAKATIAQTITGYWQGDAIHHTGETVNLHGGMFEEAVLLEGHRKGETILVVVPETKRSK